MIQQCVFKYDLCYPVWTYTLVQGKGARGDDIYVYILVSSFGIPFPLRCPLLPSTHEPLYRETVLARVQFLYVRALADFVRDAQQMVPIDHQQFQ